MATETWWHGQDHGSSRMGEAWCARRFHSNGRSMSNSGRRGRCCVGKSLRSSPGGLQRWMLRRCRGIPSMVKFLPMVLLTALLFIQPSNAVFIEDFDNCLSPNYVNSNPQPLQFKPLFVWAAFNSTAPSHNINVTVYGNVSGIATQQALPHPGDPQWTNPNETVGKIPDVGGQGSNEKFTTFIATFNVLDYTPYDIPGERFCNSSSLTPCPIPPAFNVTANE